MPTPTPTPTPTRSATRLPVWVFALATVLATIAALVTFRALSDDDAGGQTIRLDPDARIDDDGATGDDVPDGSPSEQAAEGLAVEFTTYDGETGTLADFAGAPLVVNFFSSECVPCITEMPEFQEVSERYAEDVRFVGLAVVDRREDELDLIETTGVTYFTARDRQGDVYRAFGGIGMPTTVLVSADGQVVDRHTGRLTKDALIDMIESELLL